MNKMSSSNVNWRKDHRKEANRVPKKINREEILRRCFKTTMIEYCKNSCLPGMANFVDPKLTKAQKLFWMLALILAGGTVCLHVYLVWTGSLGKPLIVSMETDVYPINLINFPAISLCNINRISKRAAKMEAERELPKTFSDELKEEITRFIEMMGKLIDFEGNVTPEFTSILDKIPVPFILNYNMIDKMESLSPKCENMLLRCAWDGGTVPCEEIFKVRRTAHGHCCVFNYVMEWDSSGRPLRETEKPKRQIHPGYTYGLNVILDPELDDYAYPINNLEGFDIFIFDSNHYPDHNNGLMIHRISVPNEAIFIEIESRKQVVTNEVRKYSEQTRKCLFKDERPEMFGKMYTYSSCIINCRIKTMQSLCKCTAYFLPVTNTSTPICTLADLRCLHKYREKFLYLYPIDPITTEGLDLEIQDSLFCPECLPDCEYTRHYTRSSTATIFSGVKDTPYSILEGINLTNKCFISIYRPSPDGILDKLDVVTYWFELLSNFGGAAGLLMGYSMVSSVEFIYFIVIRYFRSYVEKLRA